MRASIYTLGCKTNQFESQALEKLLEAGGFEIVPFESEAEVYVINTCTITATGDKKSRNAVRKILRARPGARVAICGCYAQLHKGELEREFPGALVWGNRDHGGLASALSGGGQSPRRQSGFELLPPGGAESRTRALLKVEDGCENFCSYCIVPYARGPVRCISLENAKKSLESLLESGYKEVVLTGIELSSYRDGAAGLAELTAALCAPAKRAGARIRLGSLWPQTADESFCARLAAEEAFCPHFHLSVQSGCDETLARMNRSYTVSDLEACVESINRHFDNAGITADVICGFPGETEEEFAKTLAFLEKGHFSAAHIFPYSKRKGTKAAGMAGQVGAAEKAARCAAARAAVKKGADAFLQRQVGTAAQALFEAAPRPGTVSGHTGNYLCIEANGGGEHLNRLLPVRVTGVKNGALTGEIL